MILDWSRFDREAYLVIGIILAVSSAVFGRDAHDLMAGALDVVGFLGAVYFIHLSGIIPRRQKEDGTK